MSHKKMHAHEADIDESLVRALLKTQFPQWAEFSIERVQSDGTDHALYRLGSDMCVRLPRIASAAEQIALEQQWLPHLAVQLPLAIPTPLGKGMPQENYPWHWSIYRWLEGDNLCVVRVADEHQAAADLAHFIRALHNIDPTGGPLSRRGGSLVLRDEEVRTSIAALPNGIDTKALIAVWQACLQAPAWDKDPVWTHGDLLPGNILVHNGQLSAVIDFGLMGIGDPACDIIPAWSIFSSDTRQSFRDALAVDDATWTRGRGWALSIAVTIIPYYQHTNPGLTAVAKRMIREILVD